MKIEKLQLLFWMILFPLTLLIVIALAHGPNVYGAEVIKLDNGPGRYYYYNPTEKLYIYVWLDKEEKEITYVYKSIYSPAQYQLNETKVTKSINNVSASNKSVNN